MVHLMTKVAEYAIIVDKKKEQFLLVQWGKYYDFSWHFPGGRLDENEKVEDISFEGEGCAISLASASILTDIIKGKDFNVAKKIIVDFLDMIKNETKITINSLSEDQKTTIMSLSGVKQFPMRVKCATMAWHTLNTALKGKDV